MRAAATRALGTLRNHAPARLIHPHPRCLSTEGASLQKAFQKAVSKSSGQQNNEVDQFRTLATEQSISVEDASPDPSHRSNQPHTHIHQPHAHIHSPSANFKAASYRETLLQHQSQLNLQEFAPKICVVGVGGAGGNAVNNMIARGLSGVHFSVFNTDAQHILTTLTENKVQLGKSTRGLGCGANPEAGRRAAEESREEIAEMIGDANMVFITAGMGGGTGTGAAPVVAEVCMERDILTVAVVTKPFRFEGQHRMRLAEEGVRTLQDRVDTLIVIPNQNLFSLVDPKTPLMEAFGLADDVLLAGVKSITDLMVMPGLINLDFADVQAVMQGMGNAIMGTGQAEGEDRAVRAAELAIRNPLLGNVSIKSAKGLLVNITGGRDLTLFEVDAAAQKITEEVEDPNANIIFGSAFDTSLEGSIRVSLVATGMEM